MSQVVVWNQGDPDLQLEHGGEYTFVFDLAPIGGVGNYWINIDPKISGLFGEGGYFNVNLLGGDIDVWAPTTDVANGHEYLLVDVDSYSPQLLLCLAAIAAIIGLAVVLCVEVRKTMQASGFNDAGQAFADALKKLSSSGFAVPIFVVSAVVLFVLLLPTMVGSGKKALKELK